MDQNIVHPVTIKTEPEIEGKNISLVDFPFICRICLGQSELRLFEEEQCLWDLFVTLTKIEVHSTVDFPRHVCKECINKLESISLFIDISKETDLYFGENVKVEDQTCPKPEVNERSRYCRVCSSSSNLSPFEEKITLLQLFQEITKIDVRANTNVPIENSICSRCSNELQKATDFLNLSMNNNEALRRLANIDTKKEVLRTDGDESSECLMRMNDVKDECTDEYIATDIKVDDSANRSFENFEETNENKSLHTSIDIKEELLEHMAYSDPSHLESCTRSQIESKSSEDIQEQIVIGTETSQLKSSKDKELQSTELTLFKYDHCRRGFTQKSESQTHTTEKPFKCDYCDKYFTSKSYVKKHLLTHTEDNPFKCDHCDKHFILNSNLKRHLLTHTEDKPFKCDYCDRHFNLNCNLKRHLLTHTGETSLKCHYCCKGFTHKSYLNTHLLTHTGEKPFKCDHCDRHFNLNCNLKRHLLTHTGEKPFKCCHCDKAFALKQNLNSHLLTHNHLLTQTGEKPFKCDHCDKYFTNKSSVKKHLLTHTGEKPFKCFHCDKAFALKQNLNSHILTHNHSLTQTREKPFKCDHCDKYFTSKSDVKKHLLTHTVDKPFKCN